MHKYLKIPPDPDSHVCHCGDGNPDCDHWESCDGCGMDYRKHEGHDCIDGVPVQDLRALAKELRDERDNLRRLLRLALPHVEASAGASHLLDGFRPQVRTLDALVEEIRVAVTITGGN